MLNMVYTLRFLFSSKCSVFHNSNVFGPCVIHILCTECAKIKKKNNSGAKRLIRNANNYMYMFRPIDGRNSPKHAHVVISIPY